MEKTGFEPRTLEIEPWEYQVGRIDHCATRLQVVTGKEYNIVSSAIFLFSLDLSDYVRFER